ncbi:quercetin dioxygenase-like cupin family protein [Rhizomicrobium palustre]|uniref:Quercetin dioxygenase-like cupin family protein n=1 Tax=Rhizomicrobium palustre TaxID=189966 RepID=A0A846N3Y3_9PROT|nr:hypothetical protein [Rhizomicrobium palustre]NIK89922.1 quercetin dioxygenase-like cupin family protein [Rhizomicrobium palustre]
MLKSLQAAFALLTLLAMPIAAQAQATSRQCSGQAGEVPGPACLVTRTEIGTLPQGPLYWGIYSFADVATAERAKPLRGTVTEAFGKVWLFTLGPKTDSVGEGQHLADIGPIPLAEAQGSFSAEYLKSTFTPGMTAPVHVHSGPEAFYAISGASCLEMPDGAQVARGAGHSLMVRQGPPMLLMAIGKETRQGFALILHNATHPPTTLTTAWTPKGLCPKE